MTPHIVPLSTIAKISSGKRPIVISKELTDEFSVPVIGGGGPSGYTDQPLEPRGVLITGRVGTLGKLHVADQPCWPSDNALVLKPVSEAIDTRFLRYAVSAVISEAVGLNRGAANPLVTQKDLGNLQVTHFPLDQQREIASILGALDDKIELNRRMAATLEEMARALYRSWFVDFDPVKAKAEGLAPAFMEEATAALFPDRFGDYSLPEGWKRTCLGDKKISSISAPDKLNLKNKGYSYIPTAKITGTDISGFDFFTPDKLPSRARMNPVTERIFFARMKESPKFTQILPEAAEFWNGKILSNGFAGLDPCEGYGDFLFSFIQSSEFEDQKDALVSGAVMQSLNNSSICKIKHVLPTYEIVREYARRVRPLRVKVWQLKIELDVLSDIRNSLLPKLMSGELRVGEARDQIEEVA
jgi:type I restriction enzyme, S subunit